MGELLIKGPQVAGASGEYMLENIELGYIGMGVGLLGLIIAFMLYKKVNAVKIDNERVAKITAEIQEGAMSFLKAEYKVLSIFIAVVAVALAVALG